MSSLATSTYKHLQIPLICLLTITLLQNDLHFDYTLKDGSVVEFDLLLQPGFRIFRSQILLLWLTLCTLLCNAYLLSHSISPIKLFTNSSYINPDDDTESSNLEAEPSPNSIEPLNLEIESNPHIEPPTISLSKMLKNSILQTLLSLNIYILSLHSPNSFQPYIPLISLFLNLIIFRFFLKPGFRLIFRTLKSPFIDCTFLDSLTGDILTSMIIILQDVVYTFFYIYTLSTKKVHFDPLSKELTIDIQIYFEFGCIISPLIWRFNQNLRNSFDKKRRWPELGNAFKYFFAGIIGLLALKERNLVWWGGAVLCTFYQLFWDFKYDWNFMLERKVKLIPERFFWGVAIVNVLLRFGWTLSLISFRSEWSRIWLRPIVAILEIMRRGVWAILRIEWEVQKNNMDNDIVGNEEEGKFEKMDVEGAEIEIKGFFRKYEDMEDGEVMRELGLYSLGFVVITSLIAM
ncbi:hypothetical protein TrLO_g7496 [Triparma laevis f. longispina]|uniref:EXS domain-containing protein n=1 Tax=Triparma laevis f. longispina TaxID=1714387 RepID=A0A9W7FG60_9STRA|nr:hypothetical protein TrLO_g7496 [Triparma laevis f. longispina]